MNQNSDIPQAGADASGTGQPWSTMYASGVRRADDDRWVAGVCAGVAERLDVDPVLVRVATLGLAFVGGLGVLAYAVAWLFLPDSGGRIEARSLTLGDVSGAAVGAIALLLVGLLVPGPWAWWRGDNLLDGGDVIGVLGVAAVIALAVAAVSKRSAEGRSAPQAVEMSGHGRTDTMSTTGTVDAGPAGAGPAGADPGTAAVPPTSGPPPADPRPTPSGPAPSAPRRPGRRGPGASLSTAVAGAALVAAGSTWLLVRETGAPGEPDVLAACAALAVLAVGVVGLGLAGRREGSVGFMGMVAAVTVLLMAFFPTWRGSQLAGDVAWQPVTVQEAREGWSLGLGSAVVDLTDVELPAGAGEEPVEVTVRVGVGELVLRVPEGTDVRSRVLVGQVLGAGDHRTDEPDLVVTASVGVGEIEVVEEQR